MLVISIIILIAYLTLLLRFSTAIYYNDSTESISYAPNISIIIAARNEEKNIPLLIESLLKQNYPINKYEIIIVNDRSIDNTKSLIESYQLDNNNIYLINIEKTPLGWGNKKWALTKAIESSQSDIILQTDADCIPNADWIQTMTSYFKNPNIGFVCGPSPLIHSDFLLNNLFQMESLIQEAVNAGAIKNKLVLSCTGRNIAFRKKEFNSVDGYIGNENILSGDDDLLLQKFALKTDKLIEYSISPKSLVESPAPTNFNFFLKQRLRFASKGLFYYQNQTTLELKYILILLFLTNCIFIWSMGNLFMIGSLLYLVPILIKLLADLLLSVIFIGQLKREWSLLSYLILTIIHPFYIVIIGGLGPLIKVNWKR
tara:strand:+ start:723 stop:1835 length:1113 start_codon:yes stop_codon:yes gene_type:complete